MASDDVEAQAAQNEVKFAMKLETRHAVLASTLAISGCLSGVAFGWAALVVMLKREGAFEELCDRSTDDDDGACAAQELSLIHI